MEFSDYIKKSIEILKLNQSVMSDISNDNQSFLMGIIFLAIGGVASGIGQMSIVYAFIFPILIVILAFISNGIIHLIALLFGGKANFKAFFSVIGIASITQWVLVIPVIGAFLGVLTAIWSVVVLIFTLKSVHLLNTPRAILVVLITIVGAMMIWAIAIIFGLGIAATNVGGISGLI